MDGRVTFDLAPTALNLGIEELDIDVPDLTPDRLGEFDVVLFLGFYHLVDPIRALQNLAALTKEVAIIETHLDLHGLERPGMVFYPGAELGNDSTNWGDLTAGAWRRAAEARGSGGLCTSPTRSCRVDAGSSMPIRIPD